MRHYALTQQCLLAGLLVLSSSAVSAAGRDGRDFLVDSNRKAPRTGLLGQCIRIGMPDAGAPAGDCRGKIEAPQSAAAPTPELPPAPPPAVEPAPVEPAPVESQAQHAEPEVVPVEPPPALTAEEEPEHKPRRAARKPAAPEPVEHIEAAPPAPMPSDPTPARQLPASPPPAAPTQPRKSLAHATLNAASDFDFGKAELRPSARARLHQLVASLKGVPFDRIEVVGHTDRIGKRTYNMKLSQRRADAVKRYLVSQYILSDVIVTMGVGSEQPLTKPGDCAGLKRQALISCLRPDRRVEIDVQGTPAAQE